MLHTIARSWQPAPRQLLSVDYLSGRHLSDHRLIAPCTRESCLSRPPGCRQGARMSTLPLGFQDLAWLAIAPALCPEPTQRTCRDECVRGSVPRQGNTNLAMLFTTCISRHSHGAVTRSVRRNISHPHWSHATQPTLPQARGSRSGVTTPKKRVSMYLLVCVEAHIRFDAEHPELRAYAGTHLHHVKPPIPSWWPRAASSCCMSRWSAPLWSRYCCHVCVLVPCIEPWAHSTFDYCQSRKAHPSDPKAASRQLQMKLEGIDDWAPIGRSHVLCVCF